MFRAHAHATCNSAVAQRSSTTTNTNMKALFVASLLGAVLTMFLGCASPQRGATYGQEREIRRQLAESIAVREYGYTIKELRFTPDYIKVLVVFTHADHRPEFDSTRRRPNWEFVLAEDEFGRYRGSSGQPFYTPGTANTPPVYITVTLPVK
jgi:hypothetical protein